MKKDTENTAEIMSYVAQVLHCYYYKDDLVFVLELLETSKTHKDLKKGHIQMFGMNIEKALQPNFDWRLQSYTKEICDYLDEFETGYHCPILVGQAFTFTFKLSGTEWLFHCACPVINNTVTHSLYANEGNIIDAYATNLSLEIIFKFSDSNRAHSTSNAHTSKYRIYHFNLSEEDDKVRFAHTFAPYVSLDNKREIYFSKKKLISIEHSPTIVNVDNLTSLDRNSSTLFRVISYKEEVDMNDYFIPEI